GADHIKIGACGGLDDPSGEIWHLQFTEEEIRAIVEECEDRGTYVMAHCEHGRGAKRATECGVRTIEHGLYLNKEIVKLMKEKGTYFVPTMLVYYHFVKRAKEAGATDEFIRKVMQPMGPEEGSCLESQMRAVELAHREGVVIGLGTDMGPFLPYQLGMEFKLKTECGITPYDAIKSGTIVNAEICQLEDKIGSIEVGKWADIIAVEGKPDEDIERLAEPANVMLVMKKGDVFKNTL
ncbi:unnamed protein product, partial [marine sediment metagenome]